MDEWSQRVDRWQGWAREQGRSVEFCYWGEHELWERLSKEEHRGRYFFWFNKEFFSRQWFANPVAEAIANAGPRYTPEIHVGLPIADLFEGLGRTGTFYNRINEAYGAAKIAYSKVRFGSQEAQVEALLSEMKEHAEHLFPLLENIGRSGVDPINFETISKFAFKIEGAAWESSRRLDEKRKSATSSTGRQVSNETAPEHPDVGYRRHLLSQLAHSICGIGRSNAKQ